MTFDQLSFGREDDGDWSEENESCCRGDKTTHGGSLRLEGTYWVQQGSAGCCLVRHGATGCYWGAASAACEPGRTTQNPAAPCEPLVVLVHVSVPAVCPGLRVRPVPWRGLHVLEHAAPG